ncbi:MAG TPA: ROK family protein [Jatrophihabitans sp.]|uniref:ROK family protein n=1 Tax=Jatrophihabitans sp. TaxID=1932789 RepID=UPI002EE484D0
MTALPAVLAVDVGGTTIKAAVIDQAGAVLDQAQRPTSPANGPASVVEAVRAATSELVRPGVVAAGVVIPGSVEVATGIARYSANLGWRDVPLRDLLAADLGIPVTIEHDVRAAGLAEAALGAAHGVTDCLVVVIGTGIAGVIRSAGVTLRGATDLAGEIGHIPVYPNGEPCACGQRGCLETYASAAAIARRYRALGGDAGALDAREIAAREATDATARQIWAEATDALGVALATYTLLLDPGSIVLGGGLAEAGDRLLVPVRAALTERLTWREPPSVSVSALGSRAGQLGAAILAWQAVGFAEFSSWSAPRSPCR